MPTQTPRPEAFRMFRLSFFTALAVALVVLVFLLAPQQLPVLVYKFALVTLAAVLGYWLDRHLFPYARPDRFVRGSWVDEAAPLIMIRRAVIVVGAMLALSLAL